MVEAFPEFAGYDTPYTSPPLWIESLYLNTEKTRRISAVGLECGALYIR